MLFYMPRVELSKTSATPEVLLVDALLVAYFPVQTHSTFRIPLQRQLDVGHLDFGR